MSYTKPRNILRIIYANNTVSYDTRARWVIFSARWFLPSAPLEAHFPQTITLHVTLLKRSQMKSSIRRSVPYASGKYTFRSNDVASVNRSS
jgi:hypothetical protein